MQTPEGWLHQTTQTWKDPDMTKALIKLQQPPSEKGATAVEYGLMVALIAIVIIAAVALIGTNLDLTLRRGRRQPRLSRARGRRPRLTRSAPHHFSA